MVSLFSLSLEISFDYCLLTQTRHTLAFLREILAADAEPLPVWWRSAPRLPAGSSTQPVARAPPWQGVSPHCGLLRAWVSKHACDPGAFAARRADWPPGGSDQPPARLWAHRVVRHWHSYRPDHG